MDQDIHLHTFGYFIVYDDTMSGIYDKFLLTPKFIPEKIQWRTTSGGCICCYN